MKEGKHPYALQVPNTSWEQLVILTESTHRSINMEILVAIEDHLTKSLIDEKQTIKGQAV